MTPRYPQCVLAAVVVLSVAVGTASYAAPLRNHPVTLNQPDGSALHLFVSGDEYFNWIHDKDGYTVIQDPQSGYYTYAALSAGIPVPTRNVVGQVDPQSLGIEKHILPARERMQRMMAAFPGGSPITSDEIRNAPTKGTLNNLVVFIRFNDEAEFSRQIGPYDSMFNSSSSGANSMRNYFVEASYSQLTISTTFYPATQSSVVSYRDSQPRGYYQPYSSTNTIGYTGGDSGDDRKNREHTLLKNAVTYIATQIPGSLTIDADADGYVDNICFIIKGQPTGWSSLLWPHMWSISQTAYINGKLVGTYNFQLETSLDSSGVGVLCHEMFHSLGSPDLYHYYTDKTLQPVYKWDLMEYDLNPPQHMTAYMKYRYGKWISSFPTISSGTYTINPLTSSTNNVYRINSPNSSAEYFLVEFRKRHTIFENSLPGEGLIIYRINTARDGKGNREPPDEVYVFRPGGTTTTNGTPSSANFSSNAGRTAINDSTDPKSFLSNGGNGGLNISNIGAVGSTMSFTVGGGGGGTTSAQVTSLYSVSGAVAGGTVELWAQVKNTGTTTMPSNAVVWFYVQASGVSDAWVGSVPVAGLAAGSSAWYKLAWSIPGASSGAASYWARVYAGSTVISEWSAKQDFNIGGGATASAQVLNLYPVNNAVIGGSCALWAQVKNTGGSALPAGAVVWFYVEAGGLSNPWVGSTSVAGLGAGASQWYSYTWTIPAGAAAGSATYYARVYSGGNASISDWSSGQSFSLSGGVAAQVLSLYPVSNAVIGGSSTLWAQVKNAGGLALPSGSTVWFYVEAGGLSSPWVGNVSVAGLAAGATQWFSYSWTIPNSVSSGAAQYYARVYSNNNTAISGWSDAKDFTIGGGATISAQILSLYTVSGATVGGSAKLWAQVKNNGTGSLPSDAVVWFYVSGGNITNSWVGNVSLSGLSAGQSGWYSYNWTVPSSLSPGTYTYWAQAYAGSKSISDWSSSQSFTISSGGAGSGFNEQFDGSTAPNWNPDHGSWSTSGGYYRGSVTGHADVWGISTYNAAYSDLDYTAELTHYEADSNQYWNASGLVIRASGGFTEGDPVNCYAFLIFGNGKFSVWKNVNGISTALQSSKVDASIKAHPGPNKLRVIAKGSSLSFYINNTLVWQGADSSLSSGRVGFQFYSEAGNASDQLWVNYAVLSTTVAAAPQMLTEGQRFELDLANSAFDDPLLTRKDRTSRHQIDAIAPKRE